nr:reverse transcriptase domain-containing protein [Tanacetum cinerariifolium]
MSTRSSVKNLFPPLDNPELTIRRRSRSDPTLLNNSDMAAEGTGDLPVPDLRTMEELCQPLLNGRGGPIALIAIQEMNFGLKNDMIQQVHNSCQFHGLPGDDANKHLDKFLHVTQSIKVNGVTDDSLRLYLFPHSLTHYATAWFDRLPRNSINTFEQWPKSIVDNTQNVYAAGAYQGPTIPTTSSSPVVEHEIEETKDMVHPTNNGSTEDVQPLPNQRPSFPYPSRLHDQKLRDKANDQREKFFQIFKDLNCNISFADALILMPKFGPSIKSLLTNKDKLCELARTPLNKHYSAVLLKKLPKKLGDPGKFLISCDFLEMAECLALADLGASINLIPLSMWNKLSLPDLSSTYMTLELTDRSISRPVRVAEDVFVKVGELTLRVGKEAITFNLDHTSRYSANYNDMTEKRFDIIDMACEEYSQEVLSFSDVNRDDFLLEEVDAFLALEDDPTLPKVDQSYLDTEGDILLLEAFLNDDPSLPPPNQGNYLPEVRKELKICEAKSKKSSIDEPPEVELKYLPSHLEYAFLEGNNKLPVIIVKDLSVEEKTALITVLKSHKRAITWKLSDIKGIDPEF